MLIVKLKFLESSILYFFKARTLKGRSQVSVTELTSNPQAYGSAAVPRVAEEINLFGQDSS